MRRILPAALVLALLGCDDSTKSDDASSSFPARREISATLRASCHDLSAARGASGGEQAPVQVEQNEIRHLGYGIYDSTGALVAEGASDMSASAGSAGSVPSIGWNGKDSSGKALPTGNYFVFVEVRDASGTLLQSSQYCIGLVGAS